MKNLLYQLPIYVSYAFILLFTYAAGSKMFDFENFQVQLAQSPLLSAYAGSISYGVIGLELFISVMLAFPKVRRVGLYASFGLMVAFTVYIYLILNYSDFVPCSCGGILEKMGWTEHLIFNTGCVVMVAVAVIAAYPITPKAPIMYVTEEYWMANFWQRRRDRRVLVYIMLMLLIVPSGLMVTLFLSSDYIIKKENNFTRRFAHHPIVADKNLDVKYNSYYFAGETKGKLYLGNTSAPLLITEIDTAFSIISQRIIKIEDPLSYKSLNLTVNDSIFYLSDGSVPIIYEGKISDLNAKIISQNDAYFSQIAVLDRYRFALRIQSTKTKSFTLASLKIHPPRSLNIKEEILEQKKDGIFEIDGKLVIDRFNQNLIYTYFYKNQFIVMDENLKVTSRLNTIDTTTTAQIKVYQTKDGERKFSEPPLQVNKNMAAYRQLLFIASCLKGKHEHQKEWKNSTVVDVYRTNQQEYIGSFYVQNRGQNKMSQMLVTDRFFYVLVGSEVRRYRLAQSITKHFEKGKPKT